MVLCIASVKYVYYSKLGGSKNHSMKATVFSLGECIFISYCRCGCDYIYLFFHMNIFFCSFL